MDRGIIDTSVGVRVVVVVEYKIVALNYHGNVVQNLRKFADITLLSTNVKRN
ncbi:MULTISPECIES: hypothetical protein [Photobacterium]|uniref:hypothetical protein n=1 Tax=Photobacterium TaxID=657 RepID=UPI000ADC448B|nr:MULTISPECIES: hypothetical protein [Photobacterium]